MARKPTINNLGNTNELGIDGGIDSGIGNFNSSVENGDVGNAGTEYTEPTIDSSTIGAESVTRKKRGRKPGTGTGAKKEKASLDITVVNHALFSLHLFAAHKLQSPEFALTQDESLTLAKSIAEVSKYYDISISPKAQAWGALLTTVFAIYAPKFYVFLNKRNGKIQNTQ